VSGSNGNGRKYNGKVPTSPLGKPQPKKRALLAALAETGNVSAATSLVKIDRRTHYRWLAEDPEYADAVPVAFEIPADKLEEEARRRALIGVDEPLTYQGEVFGTVKKYSDTLLIFLLKGVRPEKYRERFDHKIDGKVSFTLAEAFSKLSEPVNADRF